MINNPNEALLDPKKCIDLPLKSVLTFFMFTLNILAWACYSVIAPFMPLQYEKKGIDPTMIGYVIGVYSLSMVLLSPFMGSIIHQVGRKIPIAFGAILMGVTFQIFALSVYIESNFWYVVVSLLLRICQGAATVLIQVSYLSIVATFYPSNRDWLIGIFEAAIGAGMMMGPFIGTVLYSIGGYVFMNVAFGSVFLILALLIPKIFPSMIDLYTLQQKQADLDLYAQSQDEDGENSSISEVLLELGTTRTRLLKKPNYLFPLLCGALGYFQFDFINPILSTHLQDMGVSEQNIGIFFCIGPAFYLIGSLFVTRVGARYIEKQAWILTGIFFSIVAQLMLGPSRIFGMDEENLFMVGVGYATMGFFDTFILVFILPEMIDQVEKDHPSMTNLQKAKMADLSSGLLTAFFGIGTVAAPIYGAHGGALMGYRLTCDGMAMICLTVGVAYFLFSQGRKCLTRSYHQFCSCHPN